MHESWTATSGAQSDMQRDGLTWGEVLEALGRPDGIEDTVAGGRPEPRPGAPISVAGDGDGPRVLLGVTSSGRRLTIAVTGATVVSASATTAAPELARVRARVDDRRRKRWIIGAVAAAAVAAAGVALILVKRAKDKRGDDVEGWSDEGAAWLNSLDDDDFFYLIGRQYDDTADADDVERLRRLNESYEGATGRRDRSGSVLRPSGKRVNIDGPGDDPEEYWFECRDCEGTGQVSVDDYDDEDDVFSVLGTCPDCDGLGFYEGDADDVAS